MSQTVKPECLSLAEWAGRTRRLGQLQPRNKSSLVMVQYATRCILCYKTAVIVGKSIITTNSVWLLTTKVC